MHRGEEEGQKPSVRQMREWIAKYTRIDLVRAPFNLKDAELLSGAPACSTCTKCSIAQAELFGDFADQQEATGGKHKRKKGEKAAALCMDPACYQRKLHAFVDQQAVKWAKELSEDSEALKKLAGDVSPVMVFCGERWNRPDELSKLPCSSDYAVLQNSDVCAAAEPAIVAGHAGTGYPEIGSRLWICRHKDCKVHRTGGRATSSGYVPGNDDIERAQKKVAEEERRRRIEKQARELAFQRIRAAAQGKKVTLEDWRDIAGEFYSRLHFENQQRLLKLLELKTKDREIDIADWLMQADRGTLLEFLMCCALVGDVGNLHMAPELLDAAGARYGVSLEAIRSELDVPEKSKRTKGGAR
jgi:hypothetical protein